MTEAKKKVELTNKQLKELLLAKIITLEVYLEIISGRNLFTQGFQSRSVTLVATGAVPIITATRPSWYILTNPNKLVVAVDAIIYIGHEGVAIGNGTPIFETQSKEIYLTENTEIFAIASIGTTIRIIEL